MSKNPDSMSFEDLSSIYRVEKKSRAISAVRKDLYSAMAGLVSELRTEYEKHLSADPDSIICEGVNQHRKKALSLSKEITELRMEKVAGLALIGARGGLNVLDNLTPEEREYYDGVLLISKKHMGLVDKLSGRRKFETPAIDPEPAAVKAPERVRAEEAPAVEESIEDARATEPAAEEQAEVPQENIIKEDETVVIRILEDLPPFSGPDRNYELFKEDVVRMPKAMAMALINRDKAAVVNPRP